MLWSHPSSLRPLPGTTTGTTAHGVTVLDSESIEDRLIRTKNYVANIIASFTTHADISGQHSPVTLPIALIQTLLSTDESAEESDAGLQHKRSVLVVGFRRIVGARRYPDTVTRARDGQRFLQISQRPIPASPRPVKCSVRVHVNRCGLTDARRHA